MAAYIQNVTVVVEGVEHTVNWDDVEVRTDAWEDAMGHWADYEIFVHIKGKEVQVK